MNRDPARSGLDDPLSRRGRDVAPGVRERNVEDEMLNLMEIDRTLADLEGVRGSGAKRVFFEDFV